MSSRSRLPKLCIGTIHIASRITNLVLLLQMSEMYNLFTYLSLGCYYCFSDLIAMISRTLRSLLAARTASIAPPAITAVEEKLPLKPVEKIESNSSIAKRILRHSHADEYTQNIVRPYLYEILDWCDSLQFFEVKESDMLFMHRKKKTPEMARDLEQLPGSRGFPIFVLARYERTAKALRIETKQAHIILSVLGTQWNLLPEEVQAKINFGSVSKILKWLREI